MAAGATRKECSGVALDKGAPAGTATSKSTGTTGGTTPTTGSPVAVGTESAGSVGRHRGGLRRLLGRRLAANSPPTPERPAWMPT